ncbi:hypothetical protein FRB96_005728 [Tulasnella sp. 330]|nr:hypothetical protein FRB96_005728 [Tulasnella sp. 330]
MIPSLSILDLESVLGWRLNRSLYNDETCDTGIIATTQLGASVSLIFTGISVTVNLISGQSGAEIAILIDGIPYQKVATDDTTGHYYTCGMVPVTSETLPNTSHNVTVVKDVAEGYLFLQDIVYVSDSSNASSSTVPSSPPPDAPSIPNAIENTTTNITPVAAGDSSSQPHSSSALVLDVAICLVLITIGLTIGILVYRRRTSARRQRQFENGIPNPSIFALPYMRMGDDDGRNGGPNSRPHRQGHAAGGANTTTTMGMGKIQSTVGAPPNTFDMNDKRVAPQPERRYGYKSDDPATMPSYQHQHQQRRERALAAAGASLITTSPTLLTDDSPSSPFADPPRSTKAADRGRVASRDERADGNNEPPPPPYA